MNNINHEHPLGKGEVVSSILTGSTKKRRWCGHFRLCPCILICRFDTQRSVNTTFRVVENPGSLFADRSHSW